MAEKFYPYRNARQLSAKPACAAIYRIKDLVSGTVVGNTVRGSYTLVFLFAGCRVPQVLPGGGGGVPVVCILISPTIIIGAGTTGRTVAIN